MRSPNRRRLSVLRASSSSFSCPGAWSYGILNPSHCLAYAGGLAGWSSILLCLFALPTSRQSLGSTETEVMMTPAMSRRFDDGSSILDLERMWMDEAPFPPCSSDIGPLCLAAEAVVVSPESFGWRYRVRRSRAGYVPLCAVPNSTVPTSAETSRCPTKLWPPPTFHRQASPALEHQLTWCAGGLTNARVMISCVILTRSGHGVRLGMRE